jgi:tetratricopeptide (TPR) repeat protein
MLSLFTRSTLAQTLMLCGDFAAACAHMEEMIAPCLEPQPRLVGNLHASYAHDLAHAPWALWCLGYPDRALKVSQALRALVYSQESYLDIFQVLCDAVCFTHQLRREVRATEEALRELLPICRDERSPPVMRPFATLFLGWVHAQSGALGQGIEELRQGLAGWSAGFVVLRPHWRGFLAEALARAGRVEEGLETLDEALEQAERTGEGFSLAELYRLKGELLLQQNAPEAQMRAEACFQKALSVARQQEARSWELRATLSVARLWRRQGKRDEGRQMLAAIYGWFTEGFDTPDLLDAAALLDELSANASATGRVEP